LLIDLRTEADYLDLRLDELESLDLSDTEADYSDKNKEVDFDDLGTESVVVFKYKHEEYLSVLDLLNNARERLECNSNEELLKKLLSPYE
jgi:hypothetical protein